MRAAIISTFVSSVILIAASATSGLNAAEAVPVLPTVPAGGSTAAGDAIKSEAKEPRAIAFINSTVSNRSIALNETVRVEFTSMARQLPDIDIALTVRNALTLGATTWKLLGQPTIVENEKSRVVTVIFALQPRSAGSLDLPSIPLTWLRGGTTATFGKVAVEDALAIGGSKLALPKEVSGVANVPWGAAFDDWKERMAGAIVGRSDGIPTIRTVDGMELRFPGGFLAESYLTVPGISYDAARSGFIARWGVPNLDDGKTTLGWTLGWTRITAMIVDGGLRLNLAREDQLAKQERRTFENQVGKALDGGTITEPKRDPAEDFEKLRQRSASAAMSR